MDDRYHEINVSKAAKVAAAAGQFGLFQRDDMNLVATPLFVLSVDEDQFWQIRCKLEAKELNVWLVKSKDGNHPVIGASIDETFDLYEALIYEDKKELKRTSILLGENEIFVDGTEYVGLNCNFLEMMKYETIVKRGPGRSSVIVDDVHIFTIASQESIASRYLRPLSSVSGGEDGE